jgi:hypothetical protein
MKEETICYNCGEPPDECNCEALVNLEEELQKVDMTIALTKCTVQLKEEQGSMIKDIIQENYHYTFPHYCAKVGISPPNFYNVLNGDRPCTLDFLNKLLSGVQYEAVISNPEIQIRELEIGGIAKDVDSTIPDDE